MSSSAKIQVTLQYPPEDTATSTQILKEYDLPAFTEKVDSTYVEDVGTAIPLNLGSVGSPRALYIGTSEDIVVYINDATTGFTVKKDGFLVMGGGPSGITGIKVDVDTPMTSIRLWAVE